MKKEESRDEDENEDDSSTANPEEYDPLEADDADDDEDDGKAQCPSAQRFCQWDFVCQWWDIMHHAELVMDKASTVSETDDEMHPNFPGSFLHHLCGESVLHRR